jgi:hypothetical protein
MMLGSKKNNNMEHLGHTLNDVARDVTPVNYAFKPFAVYHKGDMSLQSKITKKARTSKK